MDFVERSAPASRLERSGHTAFIDNHTLFVFGGYQVSASPAQVRRAAASILCFCFLISRFRKNGPNHRRVRFLFLFLCTFLTKE